jgi:CBS domain-containing protein
MCQPTWADKVDRQTPKIEELVLEIEKICSGEQFSRIDARAYPGMSGLIDTINNLADRCCRTEDGKQPGQSTTADAGMDVKQVLSSFISRLPHAIIACDQKGRIRLYNSRAGRYLHHEMPPGSGDRPEKEVLLSSLMDRKLIEYALDEINEQLKHKTPHPSASFVFQCRRRILQATMVPILDRIFLFNGFVLILEDVTRQSRSEKRVESMLNTLSKNARSPLAGIRAAIEAIREFPDMNTERQEAFKEIIHKEAVVLSDILNTISEEYGEFSSTRKSLKTVSIKNLLESVSRRSRERSGAQLHIETEDDCLETSIKADPYSFTDALLFILEKLKPLTGVADFTASCRIENEIVTLDISWPGSPVKPGLLKKWEAQSSSEQSPVCLGETLDQHNGALWAYPGSETREGRPCLRLIVPVAHSEETKAYEPVSAIPESHAQISDLELFNSGNALELDKRLLTELSYTSLIREINQAGGVEEIMGKQSQLPRIIHGMLTGGSKIRTITWLITAFSDAILEKLLTFALEKAGPPPVPFAFICLGSEGRKEQTLKTDQDNAIIFEDPKDGRDIDHIQAYFLELGEMVCTWLDQAGFDFCRGGIMAKNPRWCQPLSQWKDYFSTWTHAPSPEDLLHATIFFDFRFMYGSRSLANDLTDHLFRSLAGWVGFFRNMAENALHFSPPIGLFGRLIVKKKGPRKNCLDIKMANTPIVDFARIYALMHGITETGTQDRLYRLYVKRILSRGEYNELDQAYTFNMQLRFMAQTRAILGENRGPDNCIDPAQLSSIEKRMLKEVLKKIKSVQDIMRVELVGPTDMQI